MQWILSYKNIQVFVLTYLYLSLTAPQSPTGVMPVNGCHSSTSSPFWRVFSSTITSATCKRILMKTTHFPLFESDEKVSSPDLPKVKMCGSFWFWGCQISKESEVGSFVYDPWFTLSILHTCFTGNTKDVKQIIWKNNFWNNTSMLQV